VKFGKIDGIEHAKFVKRFDLKFFPAVVGFPSVPTGVKKNEKGVQYHMNGRAAGNVVSFVSDMSNSRFHQQSERP